MSNTIKTASERQMKIYYDLISIEFVPTDHHAGGDINGDRIMSMLADINTKSLENTEDGSGEYILGVLYAWGLMDFHWNIKNDFDKAIVWLQKAKDKGYSKADKQIAQIPQYYWDELKRRNEREQKEKVET